MKIVFALFVWVTIFSNCQSQTKESQTPIKTIITSPEMDSLLAVISSINQGDPEFLSKMETSQLRWQESILADFDMRFPKSDKREYGSIFATCYQLFIEESIDNRMDILREWTEGVAEGNVCSGSVPIK